MPMKLEAMKLSVRVFEPFPSGMLKSARVTTRVGKKRNLGRLSKVWK